MDQLDKILSVVVDTQSGVKILTNRFDNVEKKVGTLEEHIDDVLKMMNLGFSEMQKSIEGTNKRIDKLYSLVDGFIALHAKA